VRTSAGGEVFRYSRDGDVRIYSLRVVASGTEVWRVTLVPHDDQPVMQAARFRCHHDLAATCPWRIAES
jgi:hypothetical protein